MTNKTPMTNDQRFARTAGSIRWSLGFGHWSLIGHWSLVIGVFLLPGCFNPGKDDLVIATSRLETIRGVGLAVEEQQNTVGICCVARAVSYRIPASDSISCSLPAALATETELRRVGDALIRHGDRLAATLRRRGIR